MIACPVIREADMTPEELIERFRNDILYDAHSYTARFERSMAQKELVRRGKESIQSIIDHLKAFPPKDDAILKTAWGHVLFLIEENIGCEETGPQLLQDTDGWIVWGEKVLA